MSHQEQSRLEVIANVAALRGAMITVCQYARVSATRMYCTSVEPANMAASGEWPAGQAKTGWDDKNG